MRGTLKVICAAWGDGRGVIKLRIKQDLETMEEGIALVCANYDICEPEEVIYYNEN